MNKNHEFNLIQNFYIIGVKQFREKNAVSEIISRYPLTDPEYLSLEDDVIINVYKLLTK